MLTRASYELNLSAAIARWRKRQTKATKCSPATVTGDRSEAFAKCRKRATQAKLRSRVLDHFEPNAVSLGGRPGLGVVPINVGRFNALSSRLLHRPSELLHLRGILPRGVARSASRCPSESTAACTFESCLRLA